MIIYYASGGYGTKFKSRHVYPDSEEILVVVYTRLTRISNR